MTPDSELLERYARIGSQDAFAELVNRHLNLVYSAALRQVNGDAHLAQDVAQTVFADLARKAALLSRRTTITGWLYTSAHFAAAKIARTENRRRDREEKFMREPIHETAPETDWKQIRPTLDKAMHELKESDREAILLRYFENQQFAEVGEKLGLNENAARMRVERALEKLRTILAHRGITATAALSTVISANAVQLAPAGLAATLTTASLAIAGTGTTLTLLKLMTMTKLKLAVSTLVVAGAAATVMIQHQAQTKLTDDNQSLHQQMGLLQNDNERLSNLVVQASSVPARTDDQLLELLRLHGEVRLLRSQTNGIGIVQSENRRLQSQIERLRSTASSPEPATLAGHRPGIYISKDQLVFAGYATPEAALESMTWAMMSGTYDQVNQSLPPEMVAEELKDPKGREQFKTEQAKAATVMKGIQIVAKKVLADDKIELKVKSDYDPEVMKTLTPNLPPEYMIQPMVRIGNEWKIGGSTRGYQDRWENDGQIQTFVP